MDSYSSDLLCGSLDTFFTSQKYLGECYRSFSLQITEGQKDKAGKYVKSSHSLAGGWAVAYPCRLLDYVPN